MGRGGEGRGRDGSLQKLDEDRRYSTADTCFHFVSENENTNFFFNGDYMSYVRLFGDGKNKEEGQG